MSGTILILTGSTRGDRGVDRVIAALRARDANVVVVDSARHPLLTQLSIDLESASWYGDERADLRDVRAVWHRHLDVAGAIGDDVLDPTWRAAVANQSELGLGELASSLPCLHVDHPAREAALPGTIGQLRLARRLGFDVPRTLVSNRPDDIRAFVAGCQKSGAVRKLLHSSSVTIQTADGESQSATESVSAEDLRDDAAVAACPMVWQERIPKARELRVTVVGRRLFVASVRSRGSERGAVDWRQDPSLVRSFEADTLPAVVESAVHRMLDQVRLNFATLDIVHTPDDRYVFLEINSLSFFDFVERATALPIAEEIAQLLLGNAPARVNTDG